MQEERSCSVVRCSTWNLGAAGSSLSGGTEFVLEQDTLSTA